MLGIYNVDSFIKYKYGKDDVSESIIRILLTSPGERVGNPDFGCNLRALLFEPEFIFLDEVKNEIQKAINKFETRVSLRDLSIEKVGFSEYKVLLEFVNVYTGSTIQIDQNVLT